MSWRRKDALDIRKSCRGSICGRSFFYAWPLIVLVAAAHFNLGMIHRQSTALSLIDFVVLMHHSVNRLFIYDYEQHQEDVASDTKLDTQHYKLGKKLRATTDESAAVMMRG